MIKKLLLSITLLSGLVIFTSSQFDDNGKAGKTNSPGEQTCVNTCHNSYALNSGPGSISIHSSTMPTFSYVPGQAYDMTVTVAQNGVGLFGVGVECLLPSGANAGTLTITDAASTRIKTATVSGNSRTNVTHQMNGGLSANSKDFNFRWTAPPAGTGNVTFYFSGVAANASGTNAGDYVYNSSQVITEACNAPAQPGAISGSQNVCEANSSQYSIQPVSGATSYTWTLPSGWSGTSTTESITATAGPTSGDITVVANNGCGASSTQTLAVTGNPLPTPGISIITSTVDTLVCNTSFPCQWYLNNNAIAGAVYPSLVPTQNGYYTVEVTDPSGCSGTSSAFSYTTLGISNAVSPQLSVYPVPANESISITVPGMFIGQELKIMDVSGKTVRTSLIQTNVSKIDVADLPEGIYFALVKNGDNKLISKIFITR